MVDFVRRNIFWLIVISMQFGAGVQMCSRGQVRLGIASILYGFANVVIFVR